MLCPASQLLPGVTVLSWLSWLCLMSQSPSGKEGALSLRQWGLGDLERQLILSCFKGRVSLPVRPGREAFSLRQRSRLQFLDRQACILQQMGLEQGRGFPSSQLHRSWLLLLSFNQNEEFPSFLKPHGSAFSEPNRTMFGSSRRCCF